MQKRLLCIVAAALFSYGCESPVQPIFDEPEFPEPSFAIGVGADPILIGVTNKGELVRIDIAAGTATKIGDGGPHPDASLAFNPGWTGVSFAPDGTLYVSSRTNGDPRIEGCVSFFPNESLACAHLYTVNPQNGLILTDEGSLGYPHITDIDWSSSGVLGALRTLDDAALGAVGGFLSYDVDLNVTAFADLGGAAVGYPEGSGGLAYDESDGSWWGAEYFDLPSAFSLDPSTGLSIAGTGVPLLLNGDTPEFGFPGMTITSEGRVFATRGGEFELYEMDLQAGVVVNIPLTLLGGITGKLTSIDEGMISDYDMVLQVSGATVEFDPDQHPNADAFELQGLYSLDAASDGIDPVGEDVTVLLASFSETVPAGAFVREEGESLWRYVGNAPGLTLVEIGDDGSLVLEGDGVTLAGVDQVPAPLSVQIANDRGATEVLFEAVGQAPPRPTSHVLASTDRGEIVSIDFGTGAASVVGRVIQYNGRVIGWTGLAFADNGNLFVSAAEPAGQTSDACDGAVYDGGRCAHIFIVEADSGYVFTDVGSTGINLISDLTFQGNTLLADYFGNEDFFDSGALASIDTETAAANELGRHGEVDGIVFSNGGMAYDDATGTLWVVEDEFGVGRLAKVDPSTGAILETLQLTEGGAPIDFGFSGLEVLPDGIMVGLRYGEEISIDPRFQFYQISPNSGVVTPLVAALPSLTGHLTGVVFAEGINRTPKANAGHDQALPRTGPMPLDVTLDGSASFDPDGGPLQHAWIEDGVTIATGETPTVSLGLGAHEIRLLVEDAAGAVRWSDVVVTITNVAPVADAGEDFSTPASAGVELDGSASGDLDGGISLFEWLIDGDVVAAGETATLSLAAGAYDVTLRVTDNDGATAEDDVRVTVVDRVEIVLQPDRDAFLRPVFVNINEGGNDYLSLDDGRRVVLSFDLGDIDPSTVTSATLVLTPDPAWPTWWWSRDGGYLDAHRLAVAFEEGDGDVAYNRLWDVSLGRGSGVTWNCRVDTRIQNLRRNCQRPDRWDGGDFAVDATASALQQTGSHETLVFDVTADVVAGESGWLIKKRDDGRGRRGRGWLGRTDTRIEGVQIDGRTLTEATTPDEEVAIARGIWDWRKDKKEDKDKNEGREGDDHTVHRHDSNCDHDFGSAGWSGDTSRFGLLRLFSREGAPNTASAPRLIIEIGG